MLAPVVVPASEDWQGNDGPWSTFTLQVGKPAQDLEVLISTAAYQTLVILPQDCTSADPTNCGTLRGGEFLPNQSTTWVYSAASPNGLFGVTLATGLGYAADGAFGYDTVALGWQGAGGPSLDQQVVGGIATQQFFLGYFGLNPRPSNFSTFKDPVPSYLQNLKNQSMIPSLSWGYTAGNQYRLDKVLGNLVLGGYDASRFVPNDVTFAFDDEDTRDLTVDIETIIMTSGNGSTTLSSTRLAALIDSTMPYLFLPVEVCQNFEAAFGITWNDSVQAYLVNDTLHASLEAQNANVTFTLGNSTAESTVNITLPYAAFDLIASYPLAVNFTRYFPLMRATNESQYTLGRTFLQEAYLIADYERRNFSVSQCSWIADSQQTIVAIPPVTDDVTPVAKPFPLGGIIGAIIGGVAGLVVTTILICYLRSRLRRVKLNVTRANSPGQEVPAAEQAKFELPLNCADRELDTMQTGVSLFEIDSRVYLGAELEDRGRRLIFEMAAREEPASEMPGQSDPKATHPSEPTTKQIKTVNRRRLHDLSMNTANPPKKTHR